MRYVKLDEAILLHETLMHKMQGLSGYDKARISYLESALTQIQNDKYYPSFLDKLTHLCFACVKFHPFLDGNKRTALLLSKAFVMLNCPETLNKDFYQRLEDVVVDVAEDRISKEQLKEVFARLLIQKA